MRYLNNIEQFLPDFDLFSSFFSSQLPPISPVSVMLGKLLLFSFGD